MDCFKETKRNVDNMLRMLHCVNCSLLPKEKLYIVYECDHKYCDHCIPKDGRSTEDEKCRICNSDRIQVSHDIFATSLLHELYKFRENLKVLSGESIEDNRKCTDPEFKEKEKDIIVDNGDVEMNLMCPEIIEGTNADIIQKDNEDKDLNFNPEVENMEIVVEENNLTVGETCGVAIANIQIENQIDDMFVNPFDSEDDYVIVATQLRRSLPKVKPKKIFDNNLFGGVGTEVVNSNSNQQPQYDTPSVSKLSKNDKNQNESNEPITTNDTLENHGKGKQPSSKLRRSHRDAEEKPDEPSDKIIVIDEQSKSSKFSDPSEAINNENQSEDEEHERLQLPPLKLKSRLSLSNRKLSTFSKEKLSKNPKKSDRIENLGEPKCKEPRSVVQTEILIDEPQNMEVQQCEEDAKQEAFAEQQNIVKRKNLFFKSKNKTIDKPTKDCKADNDDTVKSIDAEKDKFLDEILNPRGSKRMPFKPLKTYSKSSKPKSKPRLNLDTSDSDDDIFSTPKPVNKKVENPPDLTPYVNKSYNPVRKPKPFVEGGENISVRKKLEDNSCLEKIFDFNDHSPSPPPLTPYPIESEPVSDKKGSIISSRISKRTRTSFPNGNTTKSNASKNTKLKSRSIPQSSTRTTPLPITTKEPVLCTPKLGRRASSIISTVSSNGSGSSSSLSSLTPGSMKRNSKGETNLHVAARKGDIKKVNELIASGIDIDAVDYNGYTALHEAISSRSKLINNFAIAEILCAAGCNVNVPAGDLKETPLHEASRLGFGNIVKLLLEHKASPNIRSANGNLARDLTTSESVQKLFDDAAKLNEETDSSSQATDDPAVLKIQSEKAVIFFTYDAKPEIVTKLQRELKIKVSKELKEDVTHLVFCELPSKSEQIRVPFSYEYLYGLLNGAWLVGSRWIEDCLKQGTFISPKVYEVIGCESSTLLECHFQDGDMAPKRARVNKELGHPGLFHGMNILIYKSTIFEKLTKKDLGKLICVGNGVVINREPNPDAVDPMEDPVRFHAQDAQNKLILTSHVILFDQTNEPTKKWNMEHVKSLNVKWLIDSAVNFKLLDPEDYIN